MQRINWWRATASSLGAAIGSFLTLTLVLSGEDFMGQSLFGEGWYFSDLLVYCGLPFLDFLVVLAGGSLGAVLADFIYHSLRRDKARRSVDRKLILASSLGATIGGLASDLASFWVFHLGSNSRFTYNPSSVTSLKITPLMLAGAFLGAFLAAIATMFMKERSEPAAQLEDS